MSSFSFLPLPSAASTTPSKNIQERSNDATDRHTRVMDSKAAQNNVQNIPFGYNPVENMGQKGSRIRDEAPFLGASSSRTSPDDPIRAQDPHRSPEVPSPNISIPLYFHPMHGAGGLVCGIEESTKFNTLTNLLTSSWSAAADQSTPKELLCFTAENGSLGLVASLNAAAQATNIEPEIIVLTPSWNVERLKESLSHHKNVVALPLLIHRLDVQHDDMYYLHTIYGKDHYLHRENQPTGLPSGRFPVSFSNHKCWVSLQPFFNYYNRDDTDLTKPVPWVQWNRSKQPLPGTSSGLDTATHEGHPTDTSRPFVLCIDWTGLAPQHRHIQSTLGSVILRCWYDYAKLSPEARRVIVCDSADHYLRTEPDDPFARTIGRHITSHGPSSTAPSHGLLLLSQSPITLPSELLDYLSFLIIHRFTSPRWYSKLQEHFLLPSCHVVQNSSPQTPQFTPVERIMHLLPHQVLLYAPAIASPEKSEEGHTETPAPLYPKPLYKNIFGPIQRPTHTSTRSNDGRQKLGSRLLAITFKPSDGDNKGFKDIKGTRYPEIVSDPPGISGFDDLSAFPSRSSDGHHNRSSSNRHTEENSLSDRHEDSPWLWTNRQSNTMNKSGMFPDEVQSPATAVGSINRPLMTNSPFQVAVSRPSPRFATTFNIANSAFSQESQHLSPGVTSSTSRSPSSPRLVRGGLAFSPFPNPNGLGGAIGGIGGTQMSTSAPTAPPSSPYQSHPPYAPTALARDHNDTLNGASFTRRGVVAHQPLSASSQTTNEGSMSRTDTDSRDGSSNDFVDIGSMRDSIPTISQHPRDPTISPTLTRSSGSGFTASSSNLKPSYADVMALSRDNRGIHRHDTAILVGNGEANGPPQQMTSSRILNSNMKADTPGDDATAAPPALITYPEPFFWPLLDALEKARLQVSSPHNRAQCVRHSVVGQELPPSARARLGLTFKEYVAAAARQSIIVTGDSGDKAWIAMKEWKYPGKLMQSSASSSSSSHHLASSSGGHNPHGQQGLYHHGSRMNGK